MAANTKTTTKKKPAKKNPVRAAQAVEVVDEGGNSPVNHEDSDFDIDDVIAQREQYAERWAEAWRMSAIGIPLRQIGERLGVSHVAARNYIRKHQMLVWGDPNLMEQRADVLARMDQIIENMSREMTALDAAQRQLPAKRRAPVWLVNAEPLMKALQTKWRMMNPEGKPGKVSVEVGVIPGSSNSSRDRNEMRLPKEIAAVLAKVTVEDSDEAA